MKAIFRLAAAIAISSYAVVIAPTAAAQPFEGVISMSLTGSGAQSGIATGAKYIAAGGKARIELETPMGMAAMIVLPAEKKLYMLVEAMSQYIEQDLGTALEAVQGADIPKVESTGRKEKIAGHECEISIVDGMEVCAARGLGTYLNIGGNVISGRGLQPWQNAIVTGEYFPLRVKKVGGEVHLLVTKIERKKIDPAMFRVPEGYSLLNIPSN